MHSRIKYLVTLPFSLFRENLYTLDFRALINKRLGARFGVVRTCMAAIKFSQLHRSGLYYTKAISLYDIYNDEERTS